MSGVPGSRSTTAFVTMEALQDAILRQDEQHELAKQASKARIEIIRGLVNSAASRSVRQELIRELHSALEEARCERLLQLAESKQKRKALRELEVQESRRIERELAAARRHQRMIASSQQPTNALDAALSRPRVCAPQTRDEDGVSINAPANSAAKQKRHFLGKVEPVPRRYARALAFASRNQKAANSKKGSRDSKTLARGRVRLWTG